jgi:hypothetical protein
VCVNGLGLVGFIIAIWPKKQSFHSEMRTS